MIVRKQHFLSILLALTLVLGLLPTTAWAASEEWIDQADTSWYADSSADVFTINSAAELAGLASLVNAGNHFTGKTIHLGADIDLSGYNWTPIGTSSQNSFQGTFNGNNHVIKNLSAINNSAYGNGFFGNIVGSTASVENLTFENAYVSRYAPSSSSVSGNVYGIVSAYAYSTVTFENVHVKNSAIRGYGKVGSVLGMAADKGGTTTLKNCTVEDTTVTAVYNAGGLIGLAQNPVVLDGCSTTNVTPNLLDAKNQVYLDTTATDAVQDKTLDVAGHYWKYPYGEFVYYYAAWGDFYTDYDYADKDCALTGYQNGLLADGLCHNAAAEVNGTKYSTLQQAIKNAAKTSPVLLLSDVTLSDTLTINKSLTINGNNKTITCSSEIASGALLDVTANNVSIENLTVNTNNLVKHGVQFYCTDGGKLSNVTVNGGSYTAVIINGARNVILQDCTLNSNGYTNIEYAMGGGVVSASRIPSFTVNNVSVKAAGDNGSPVMIWADNSTVSNLKTALGDGATDEAVLDKIQEGIVNQDRSELIAYVYLGMTDETTPNIQTISIGQHQYTLTISGGGTGATTTGNKHAMGATVSISAGSRDGYTFTGWSSDDVTIPNASQSETSFTMPGNDVTVIANWTRNSSGSSSSSGNTTETTTNPDGSTTTTVTKPDGTVTETTTNTDGSKEVVETDKDGTVTTTTTDTAGNKTETVEKTDGSSQTTVTNKDGSSSTTTVSEHGQVESQVKLPAAVIEDAQKKDEAVALPMPQVPVTSDQDSAPSVTVSLPSGTSAKVEIPVANVTPGTVAVLVKADGSEEIIKTSLTTEAGVAVTLEDGATVKIVDNSKDFADVPNSYWGEGFVDFATSRGLFAGTSERTFSPDLTMNRAMIVTVLASLDGADTTAAADEPWYSASQQWAIENGVSDGSGMEDSLTREQLAVMLWSYAGRPQAAQRLSGFGDAASISDWAVDAMAWAVENGMFSGSDTGDLLPQGQTSRVQAATILMRFVEALHG